MARLCIQKSAGSTASPAGSRASPAGSRASGFKSQRRESNPQPPHYECGALPIEATLAESQILSDPLSACNVRSSRHDTRPSRHDIRPSRHDTGPSRAFTGLRGVTLGRKGLPRDPDADRATGYDRATGSLPLSVGGPFGRKTGPAPAPNQPLPQPCKTADSTRSNPS